MSDGMTDRRGGNDHTDSYHGLLPPKVPAKAAGAPRASTMRAHEICARAAELTGGDRAVQHGDKAASFAHIARVWSAFMGVEFTAADVALLMGLLKAVRTKHGAFNNDDFVDMAGYAGVAGEVSVR